MFYQTQTARKPPKSPPGSDGMVPSAGAASRYLQQARSIPSMPGVMGVHNAFLSLVTLTFDLWP